MKFTLALSLLIFCFFNSFGQERYVKPVDEAKKDASFLAFRSKLIEAVKRRDAKYVLSILDPKIKLSFGDSSGIADFKKIWKIDDPQSEFWDDFSAVITNGGSFLKSEGAAKQFWAPYTFNSFPDDLDAFEYSAIFGSSVNLRSQPSTDSTVVASLSYNVVKVDYAGSVPSDKRENDYSWLKVETLGGKKGFVKAEYVRSPVDYRAGFEKKNGRWKMTIFLAGD